MDKCSLFLSTVPKKLFFFFGWLADFVPLGDILVRVGSDT